MGLLAARITMGIAAVFPPPLLSGQRPQHPGQRTPAPPDPPIGPLCSPFGPAGGAKDSTTFDSAAGTVRLTSV